MTTSRPCSVSSPRRPARPRPGRGGAAFALALAASLAILLPPPAAADSAARDEAICASLTRGAVAALALGRSDQALALLDEALSYRPADPDACYLSALARLSRGDGVGPAARLLETALSAGGFRLYAEGDARLLYAGALERTGRPAEALRFLAGLPPSAESLYIGAKAALAVGDEAGARSAVLSSLRRYPADPRPLLFWLRYEERPYLEAEDAAVVAAGFAALERLKAVDPAALVALAPYASSADQARLMLREYRAAGRRDAESTALALRYGLIDERRAASELLSGAFAPTLSSLEAVYSLLPSDEARVAFGLAFAGYAGAAYRDDDRDGYPESVTEYRAGLPSSWILDGDQDGEPELAASFDSGAPARLSARSGSTTVVVEYAPWPYAASVSYADAAGKRSYSFGPSTMPLPLLSLRRLGGLPGAPYAVSRSGYALPTETAAKRAAYAMIDSGADGSSVTLELSDGRAVRSWWVDERRRVGMTVYRNGVPDDERIDADADGRFETRRVWARGPDGVPTPAYAEADLDGDGLYEYRETLSGPSVKSWDYDGDGAIDLSLESLPDGRALYRVFARDGGLIEATLDGGRLSSVVERGSPVPIVDDSGGLVRWIGAKPFDFGVRAPPIGRGSRDGVMYAVHDIGGLLYAQVLRE
ncbi:MAG TPA: hypothetical protein P5298_02520 [Spirochaetia bacterium]|nr:hypothetical protein [Spirochaetia bacterium]